MDFHLDAWPFVGRAIAALLALLTKVRVLLTSAKSSRSFIKEERRYSKYINLDSDLDLRALREDFEKKTTERRSGVDRRTGPEDRRLSTIDQRMRYGFGLYFYRFTKAGDDQSIWRDSFVEGAPLRHRAPFDNDQDLVKALLDGRKGDRRRFVQSHKLPLAA
jgi:hypothetical protein